MSLPLSRVSRLIVDQLSSREMRVLSLTVAVRKALDSREVFKGDLGASVRSALRKLIASRTVVEVDGTYSLAA
jgi:hypothetical protein